ncbi:flavin reductase family protein [Rhodococcus enclensis]|nr:flavin reductase family protein [Rhodococcus qingshengii]
MAAVCAPVAVVTAVRGGAPFGTTVSAFASLSMSPPMVLVSLDRASTLLGVVREVRNFGVNVLGSEHAHLAVTFSGKGGSDKFVGVEWNEVASVPQLTDMAAFVGCTVVGVVEGGDHVVLLGEVVTADHRQQPPLTYHRRTFGTHLPVGDRNRVHQS